MRLTANDKHLYRLCFLCLAVLALVACGRLEPDRNPGAGDRATEPPTLLAPATTGGPSSEVQSRMSAPAPTPFPAETPIPQPTATPSPPPTLLPTATATPGFVSLDDFWDGRATCSLWMA